MAELSEVHEVHVYDDRDGSGALVFQAVPSERPAETAGACTATREVILAWDSRGVFRFEP